MTRIALAAFLAVALAGCHSELRKFVDGGGYQKLRAEERAEEREREKQEWTRKCRELFKDRKQSMEALSRQIEGSAPKGDAELKALRDDYEAQTKKLILDVPYQCSHEPQKQDRVAYEEYFHAERARVRGVLLEKSVGAGAPRQARTLLFTRYNRDVNTKDPELERLAREIAAQYDAELLTKFKKYGGYGKTGVTQDKVVCVFSSTPWPDDLGSEIEPRFATHFVGREEVIHVLCRLPLPAKRYSRQNAQLFVQLLSDNNQVIDVATSLEQGTPEAIGDTPYLRTAFELPPNARFDHSRYFFDVRVLLVWNAGDGQKSKVLSQSSFTWQASE